MKPTWRSTGLACLVVVLLSGCSGRDVFGWQSDLWGNPYPPQADEIDARYGQIELTRTLSDSLQMSWKNRGELRQLCDLYEEQLAYCQARAKERLERHYNSLSPEAQARFGPAQRQPDESEEDYLQRANDRFTALRDAADQDFDEELYNAFWRLSNNYYFLAEGLLDESQHVERLETHNQGMLYGERALACFPAFREAIAAGEPVESAVTRIGVEGIEAIYWTTANLARWANLMGLSYMLFYKNKGKGMIEHIRELDPTWYYGAANRYLGVFYSKVPSIAGGDMELGWKCFQKSLEVAPNYFGTHNLIAEIWATQMQDRALFESELRFVLDTPVTVLPELVPLQRIEKVKAQALLDRIDEFF